MATLWLMLIGVLALVHCVNADVLVMHKFHVDFFFLAIHMYTKGAKVFKELPFSCLLF